MDGSDSSLRTRGQWPASSGEGWDNKGIVVYATLDGMLEVAVSSSCCLGSSKICAAASRLDIPSKVSIVIASPMNPESVPHPKILTWFLLAHLD